MRTLRTGRIVGKASLNQRGGDTTYIKILTDVKGNLITVTSAVNNGEKHLVDFIRQPDGKSLGILGQVT